ncbi:30S ribosomal protein S6 domain protein [Teladorsagia circumcincta]|uniref:30S ribosomal protein S6 domain protein n=1 Tax=Teladorsagia circumcincta TaxID=45464 RepID=A0A2G9UZ12_TELCI|nr:30S ribosomal protein S6 domain protein [Teladorsagia circumcincta]
MSSLLVLRELSIPEKGSTTKEITKVVNTKILQEGKTREKKEDTEETREKSEDMKVTREVKEAATETREVKEAATETLEKKGDMTKKGPLQSLVAPRPVLSQLGRRMN